MLHRSTIQLLRFHFSLFLLPVYLFALSELPAINWPRAILVFIILHILVYPSSNGYNSYMDRDETSIGGLERPPMPTRQLFLVSIIMDAAAILLSLLISPYFSLGIFIYIIASRAYSFRGIRLKQYPLVGFLTVFVFQGAWIFFICFHGIHPLRLLDVPLIPALISSLLIGALYPLTQVYQHEADQNDGVRTISMLLGKKGSFVFSMVLFMAATALLYRHYTATDETGIFFIYLMIMFPVVSFFLYWMYTVWKDGSRADFRNSLLMNVVAMTCTSVFFISRLILKN